MNFRNVTPDSIAFLRSAGIAEQAKLYIKLTKLHRMASQNVWFNQQCKRLHVIPNYINIRTSTHSRSSDIAIRKARSIWLDEECRYWFSVRDNLKLHLRVLHSELSFNLHNVEFDLLDSKARDLASRLAHDKFVIQSRKLDELANRQTNTSNNYFESYSNTSLNRHTDTLNIDSETDSHIFYPRVKNLTNIDFPSSEVSLLEKGLKYNINPGVSHKSLQILAVDSEIACIRGKQDVAIKHQVASQIKTTLSSPTTSSNPEFRLYKSLQERLSQNDLIVSKADKGNTIVILDRGSYNQKVNDIIQGDAFEQLNSDPTKKFTSDLRQAVKNTSFISQNCLKNIIPMNPRPPCLYGLPKLHKDNIPIRPVVSYVGAPAYKLAKHLNILLKTKSSFAPRHSLKNSLDLIDKVKNVQIPPGSKLISLDVDSLFTNVPYEESLRVLGGHFERQRLHPGEKDDLLNLTSICMEQNYFQFNNQFYRQKEGLAMGSPLSPFMAEVFMDNFESKHIVNEPKILFYYRYVDDILICWTGSRRQMDVFLNKINNIHPKIKFKLEIEENSSINFLDLTLTKVNNKINFQIYRKPTHTDVAIPSSSCHPFQHKLAAFRSYVHRLMTVPLTTDNYVKELNIIYQIALSNGYSKQMVDNLIKKKQKDRVRSLLFAVPPDNITKFVGSLTYLGTISEKIAKLLKKNNVHVAFRTNQNMRHLCNGKDHLNNNKKSGVYKLTCDGCNGVYIGQTGRNFETRFKEHIAAYRNDHPDQSHFAKHLIDTGHSINDNNTYKILHVCEKGFRLCVLEQLEILKHNNQAHTLLNDQTHVSSPLLRIFDHASRGRDDVREGI